MVVFPERYWDKVKNEVFLLSDSEERDTRFSSVSNSQNNYRLSYLAFVAFALAYFWIYLPQGFSPLDDAYLSALGQRISGGEKMYVDFYYLRTPLSPWIQSLWIDILGSHYTHLVSRIIWAIQLCATIVIASLIYRRWLSAIALAIVLCATLVYSSLLFAFPWYTYDGMFFTALFASFIFQKRMFVAGVFAGLAFLSKQGFVALIPLYFALSFLETRSAGDSVARWWKNTLVTSSGALVVALVAVLALDASLPMICNNIFVLPKAINDLPLSFLLYQDLPETFLNVWPYAIPLLIIVALPLRVRWKTIALSLWLVFSWTAMTELAATLPQALTLVTFVSVGYFFFSNLRDIRGLTPEAPARQLLKFSALALVVLYVAGFNYNGWVFSYIGGVISLPALALWFSAGGQKVRISNAGVIGFSVLALSLALVVHHDFPYKGMARAELNVPFATPALSGLFADSTTVEEIDGLVSSVQRRTNPEDYVLAFPDPASLSFIANRRAWGPIQWYYEREFDSAMAQESVRLLSESPPALIVLNDPEYIPETPRFDTLYQAIYDNFELVDTVGPFHILMPRCSEESLQIDQ